MVAGDAPAPHAREQVRPDVGGDIEIVGELVSRLLGLLQLVVGHGGQATRARRRGASRSSSCQGLGQHPGLGHAGHEVGVAVPPRQHVHVHVARDPRTGGPPDVDTHVDPFGRVGRLQRGGGVLGEGHDCGGVVTREGGERALVAQRRDHQMP